MVFSNTVRPVPRSNVFGVCWERVGLLIKPLIDLNGQELANMDERGHVVRVDFWVCVIANHLFFVLWHVIISYLRYRTIPKKRRQDCICLHYGHRCFTWDGYLSYTNLSNSTLTPLCFHLGRTYGGPQKSWFLPPLLTIAYLLPPASHWLSPL